MSVQMRSCIESNTIRQPLLVPCLDDERENSEEITVSETRRASLIIDSCSVYIPDASSEAVFRLQELPKDLSQLVLSFVKKEEHSNLRLVSKHMRQSVDWYRMQLDRNYGSWLENAFADYEAAKRLKCIRLAKRVVAIAIMPIALPLLGVLCLASCPCFYLGAITNDCACSKCSGDDCSPCYYPALGSVMLMQTLFRMAVHGDSQKELRDCRTCQDPGEGFHFQEE